MKRLIKNKATESLIIVKVKINNIFGRKFDISLKRILYYLVSKIMQNQPFSIENSK